MRRVLFAWALFGVTWVLGHALLDVLVRRHVEWTATALWTAVLVPGIQALAVESLAAPFGLRDFLIRARRTLRRPAGLTLSALAVLGLLSLWLALDSGIAAFAVARAALATIAAALFASAVLRHSGLAAARGALLLLAALLLVTASNRVVDGLAVVTRRLLPAIPSFAALIVLLPLLALLYASLFRAQTRIAAARGNAASWLGAAAGIGTLGLVAELLPWRLTTSPTVDFGSLLPPALLYTATLCLGLAGLALWTEEA